MPPRIIRWGGGGRGGEPKAAPAPPEQQPAPPLRPSTDDLMERAQEVLAGDLAAFNAVASRAGAAVITIK